MWLDVWTTQSELCHRKLCTAAVVLAVFRGKIRFSEKINIFLETVLFTRQYSKSVNKQCEWYFREKTRFPDALSGIFRTTLLGQTICFTVSRKPQIIRAQKQLLWDFSTIILVVRSVFPRQRAFSPSSVRFKRGKNRGKNIKTAWQCFLSHTLGTKTVFPGGLLRERDGGKNRKMYIVRSARFC